MQNDGVGMLKYLVLGVSRTFPTSFISCIIPSVCVDLNFAVNDEAAVYRTDLMKGFGASLTMETPLKHRGSFDRLPSNLPVSAGNKHQLGLVGNSQYAEQVIVKDEESGFQQVCLLKHKESITRRCDICLKRASDAADMEKYFVYRSKTSVVYMIYASKWNVDTCIADNICAGSTTQILDNLCELIKFTTSSTKFQKNKKMPQVLGEIEEHFTTYLRASAEGNQDAIYNEEEEPKYTKNTLEKFLMPWSCRSTKDASFWDDICWKCLADMYKGMVLFDTMVPFPDYDGDRRFLIRLFGTGGTGSSSQVCKVVCGTILPSNHCKSDIVRVDNFVPPNDITFLLEQKPSASKTTVEVKDLHGCVMVKHLLDRQPDCLEIFHGKTQVWNLTPITFLMSIYAHTKGADVSKSHVFHDSGCVQLEVMPEIMCQYKIKPIAVKEDLNFEAHGHHSFSSPAAKLIVVEWKTVDLEDVEEYELFEDCFTCITTKRKVVLMSLVERFVWIVLSDKPLQCYQCQQNLRLGGEVAYDSYLRQISVEEVKEYFSMPRTI